MVLVNSKKNSKKATETAAYWLLKLESQECKPSDRLVFENWRNSDPNNARAFLRAQKALAIVDKQLGNPDLSAFSEQILMETRGLYIQGKTLSLVALSAVLLLTTIWLVTTFSPEGKREGPLVANYITGIGERSKITLSDKSVISLNANSHLVVDFFKDPHRRTVSLLSGQAHFEVENDPRTFEVFAADRRILALGTSFNVKLDSTQGLLITLVEGDIEVEKIGAQTTKLQAGEQLVIKPNAEPVIQKADL
ncbi:MAG: FecR family protein [Candidatus Azotimanducaceae bacterium]|uniref:DUF4880 domain-containing protein n=1 Tax=OM182 bacterium TaxID=2510334 RepID=A0A520S342_9GAMM|nr:hypothetical protein [Gammaproteobacteria bacterium]OUV67007.1 MAG: hypothetical protein CBC93_06805 [Gammaproteobacteria bacterium TMED133]RZO76866.1 MAG: DUF4880 domain-containing protein [OM182 bacterium]